MKKSPSLLTFKNLIACAQKIPMFDGFVTRSRIASSKTTSLTYFYRSPAAYSRVKAFYVDYFSQNGWTLTRQKENSWGPDELEFKKPTYRIIISHGGLGEAEYALDCDKLSYSGEPLPNKALQLTAR